MSFFLILLIHIWDHGGRKLNGKLSPREIRFAHSLGLLDFNEIASLSLSERTLSLMALTSAGIQVFN